MKLFRQLLVAPAALGLMAPLAANAAEVNITDVAAYSNSEEQLVETTNQFSDVVPGDWAYTALQNLGESYGCVDNAYTQTLKSGQALTRYEAAALVNACLEGLVANGQGLTPDAARLTNEFGSEMAILKGRVDGLEYKLNEYNAGQFASTTLMSGSAVFSTGAVEGTAQQKLHNIYAYGIDLTTSFTGEDSLDVEIIAGNAGTEPLNVLDSAESTTGNALTIDTLSYTWPIGDFTVTAGPLMDEDQVISATLSNYSDAFYITNQPYTTESSGLVRPGVGATYYGEGNWNASLSFLFEDGADGATGIGSEEGDDVYIASLGYDADNWGGGIIVQSQDDKGGTADYKATGVGVYFSPVDANYKLSVGYDEQDNSGGTADNEAWTAAIDYDGIGPGTLSVAFQNVDNETDTLLKAETYYNWEVADGISLQPGFFINEIANADDEIGVVVETYFKF